MKKFVTGLRYGNWQTRLYVISIPVCVLSGAGLIIASFFVNSMVMFLAGIALEIAVIALIQNYAIEEVLIERPEEGQKPTGKRTVKLKKPEEAEPEEIEPEESEREESSLKEPEPEQPQQTEEPEKKDQEPEAGESEPKARIKKARSKKEKIPKEKPEPERAEEEKHKPEEKKPEQSRAEKEEELVSYDEKKIKQVLYKYKVRKDHKMIIIDEWKEKNVHQCPVYIWVHRGRVHFLMIEGEARELSLPLAKAATLKYRKGIVCKAKEEYIQMRKNSLLSAVFEPFLPTYHNGNKNGRAVIYKNLFELGNGLLITNTSARTVMDLLHPEFQVEDSVTRNREYNDFYREIYKNSILFREQVIPTREYQARVNDILQQLAGSGAAEQEYEDTLQQLYRGKLITQEYITYYLQYRGQLQSTEAVRQGKRLQKGKKLKRKKRSR